MRGWLMGALVAMLGTGTMAAETRLTPVYDLYLGGIKAAELSLEAQIGEARYQAKSTLRTAGIVGVFYKAQFDAEAEGMLDGAVLSPSRFAADSQDHRKTQYVEMRYEAGAPSEIRAEPAFIPKPYEIEPTEQIGTTDPITAALLTLGPRPAGEICSRTIDIFDGRRRYEIALGAPEPDGARQKCPALYRRIGGFKPKMMAKQVEFPFFVWFVERADGKAEIVRAAGGSVFGLVAAVLRE